MKILVTGSKGFIGKNLIAELRNRKYTDIYEFDQDTEPAHLDEYCKEADFVFHLAGVNRPKEQSEFMDGNFGFTTILVDTLRKYKNTCPVMISSSIQAELDNPYGESKKAGEDLLFDYGVETGAKILVYRFPNVFGKWGRPNYNSAVATFCYNISHELPIHMNTPDVVMNLVYIDDVINELIHALEGNENRDNLFCKVPMIHTITLGEIADLIFSFKKSREEKSVPNMSDAFTKKLYSTYLSYLPENQFSYDLKMNVDDRGSFTEFIKTPDRGQVSVNISKPGIIKGNHWHHSKNEKFLVVSGQGIIRFRKIDSDEVLEYFVNGEKMTVVDIPTGYTHNIENLGETEMVTIMWANEAFNPEKPDTYFLEV
ncbi:UDP-2-acetamido-2,6-beta-L-arabino-hexul-4-ose reductase [Petrocella atlantisensis]|uniref:UDP-2-acetamido-2,6-beta-L-arabino-hexul-4-ose reductase n=1 Tax=Petrocella atlantisensis TaxID=2173034 RepID=A0A3P7PSK4_9FIRM|nr:capsular polysaccharide biosynthesis protein CapF [Petrocella atlantisensis]VDN46211.1 UDP-2-acetamido-2,6-beta-L-arabino-hexul-4-ose reductase [Petrocella atlantisensis]